MGHRNGWFDSHGTRLPRSSTKVHYFCDGVSGSALGICQWSLKKGQCRNVGSHFMNLPLGCFISQTPLLTFDDTRDPVVTLTVVVFLFTILVDTWWFILLDIAATLALLR